MADWDEENVKIWSQGQENARTRRAVARRAREKVAGDSASRRRAAKQADVHDVRVGLEGFDPSSSSGSSREEIMTSLSSSSAQHHHQQEQRRRRFLSQLQSSLLVGNNNSNCPSSSSSSSSSSSTRSRSSKLEHLTDKPCQVGR